MLPGFALDNVLNGCSCYTKAVGQFVLGVLTASIKVPDSVDLFVVKFCAMILFANLAVKIAKRINAVALILLVRYPFQVAGAIVCLVSIFMVDFPSVGRANEGRGHKSVNSKCLPLPIFTKIGGFITAIALGEFQNSSSNPFFESGYSVAYLPVQAFDLSRIRDLVDAFVARNVLPCLNHYSCVPSGNFSYFITYANKAQVRG